ncbi:Gfo/Idh/MocA family oxidoreductase (plasmid) [Deinococcus radiomollis]|uniref:Gfo/Idh/MocA family protein n=1 Tax=Deinococcus radiomollis TaxID=468916 RepID=UPI003891D792
MTPSALRVGLIGAGVMGRTHARAWAGLPGALVAMYVPDEGARTLARQYKLQECERLEDLFAQVDAVDLCTPTDTHLPLTLAAASAGRHVLCEKPAALTLEDAVGMRDACERAGVRLFVAHVLRFFPQYRAARDRVVAGEIGSPRVLRLSRVSTPPTPGSWLLDEAQSGGVPLDLMLHDLDYARWITGEVASVYAVQSRQEGKVMVQATLGHSGGAISLIEAGWAAPAGVFRTSLDIAGTTGATEWNSDLPAGLRRYGPELAESAGEQVGASLPPLEGDPYADELHHAYHALQHGLPFLVTPDDAVAAVSLGLAVQQSLNSGQAVTPRPVPAVRVPAVQERA